MNRVRRIDRTAGEMKGCFHVAPRSRSHDVRRAAVKLENPIRIQIPFVGAADIRALGLARDELVERAGVYDIRLRIHDPFSLRLDSVGGAIRGGNGERTTWGKREAKKGK